MTQQFSRRFFLGSAAAGIFAPAAFAAPPNTSLRPVLRSGDLFRRAIPTASELIEAANLKGQVAFVVADAKTGTVLEQKAPTVGLMPASVTKAITALYALDTLGADHRFETQIVATGGITAGEVQGDLILVGGGDPTLDTDALAAMAARLKDAGIHSVKGGFKVYEGNFPRVSRIDPEQPDHVGYNPGVSGLALNFNRVHFEWKRGNSGYAVTMDGRSARYRPEVSMAVMQVQDRAVPVYTYRDDSKRDTWTVAKQALGKNGARWLPVRKPGRYAADIFTTMAGANGIRLRDLQMIDALPAEAEVVVTQQSAPLHEILRDMLKYSTNLTAEMTGLASTIARGKTPQTLKESAAEMNQWAKATLGMQNPALVDHSGLGSESRISASDMLTALVKVNDTGTLKPILKTIVLRDEKGRPKRDHPIKVDAKTGTLNFVSTLAGYIQAPNGREMAFVVFSADETRRATLSRAQRERPDGGRAWNARAKRLQQELIERWGATYLS
ncbi:D-alanyl-D-alanine carboxypeptidase/D-alanyl-D-alanine-endopeptidase [uncultured Sulfitobacter sp.]|uniref:D-alanyl-D-alanine carboxypeptidase/D-alanyl-D-alanine endopeptidase n=1 Tax=uncultured Sulfitobacter sp. TaxID=191468 RepID=UPI0030DC962F|tara:strand:+ start:7115 stop:8611 length:1497 start_codon:yes stop_codon:yes gene_type:complete